jgi:oxygen-dependent protoporphyrinogen oxidase
MPEGMMLMAPTMILPILRSRLISWPGKLRMGMEIFVRPGRRDYDESLASFVRRRLGTEVLDKIAGPLMAGIHAGDPERLSIRSTFPMFIDMEQADGSLVLGMIRRKKAQASHTSAATHRPMFTTLAGGLQQLPDAIVAQLNPRQLRLNCRVKSLVFENGQYRIVLADGSSILASNIVFTTPAYVTADIVQQLDPRVAETLRAIRYVSTATVSLGFRRSELMCPLNGSGFIVAASEKRRINACSWSSIKFSNRAPDNCVLLRVFIGGALAEELAEQNEIALIDLARQELREILGITATPVLARAYRWHKSTPQYDVGHRELVAEIDHLVESHPGLYLAGAAYRGSGIPDCIQSGMDTALKITQRHTNA